VVLEFYVATPLPHSALETWLREQRARVSKNSETGKAID
jgi:hypothetical protein